MTDSISGRLQNDFTDYVFQKGKNTPTSNELKKVLADGTITREEYNKLKSEYAKGGNEADFDKAFMQTLSLSPERLNKLKTQDNSYKPLEITFKIDNNMKVTAQENLEQVNVNSESEQVTTDTPKISTNITPRPLEELPNKNMELITTENTQVSTNITPRPLEELPTNTQETNKDEDDESDNQAINQAKEKIVYQEIATVGTGKSTKYDYNSQQSKDFKSSVGGVLKNDITLKLGDSNIPLNKYLEDNLGDIKADRSARLSKKPSADRQIQRLQAYLGLPANRQDGLFGSETMAHLKSKYADALKNNKKEEANTLKNLISALNSKINNDTNNIKDKSLQELTQAADNIDSVTKSVDASKKGKEAINNGGSVRDAVNIAENIKDKEIKTKTLEKLADKGAGTIQEILNQNPLLNTLVGDDRINLVLTSGSPSAKAIGKVFQSLYEKKGEGDQSEWSLKPNSEKLKQITPEELALLPSKIKTLVEKYNTAPVTNRQTNQPKVEDQKVNDTSKMNADQVIENIGKLDTKSPDYPKKRSILMTSLAFKELNSTQQNQFKSFVISEGNDDKKAEYIGIMRIANKNNDFVLSLYRESSEELRNKINKFIDETIKSRQVK